MEIIVASAGPSPLELFFLNSVLPNWLPIIIAWFVLSKLSGIVSELGGIKSELKYELGGIKSELKSELGGIKSELDTLGGIRSELDTLGGIRSELKNINLFTKHYYYNSLNLGCEWAVFKKAEAEAQAVFKKAEAEAQAVENEAYGVHIKATSYGNPDDEGFEKARAEARAVCDKAEAEARAALDEARVVRSKAWAVAWAVLAEAEIRAWDVRNKAAEEEKNKGK